MKKAIVAMVIISGMLMSACGTAPQQVGNTNGGNSGIVAGEISSSLLEKEAMLYEYHVKNQTEQEVTMKFSSSQRYDFSISTKDGKEMYKFSTVALFLNVEGEEVLKPGDELAYEINLTELGLPEGEYVLSVWMTPTTGEVYKVSKDVKITVTQDIVQAEGVFIGQMDPHTIELEVDGAIMAFQTLEITDVDFGSIEVDEKVSIQYYKNEHNQYVLQDFSILK